MNEALLQGWALVPYHSFVFFFLDNFLPDVPSSIQFIFKWSDVTNWHFHLKKRRFAAENDNPACHEWGKLNSM